MRLPYFHRYTVPEHVKRQVLQVMDDNIHYLGPHTGALEAGLAAQFGKKHAVSTHAGSSALLLAMRALELGPGDEVIIPASTYAAVGECAVHAGATPVFADCEADTGNLSIDSARDLLTDRTRALVVVHQYGHPADLDPFLKLATDRGLWVIENCCHALLARYKGRPVGSFGHAGVVAMSHKHLTVCGTGGAAFTDDDTLARKMAMMRHHGNWGSTPQAYYETQIFGYKMYLNEIQAAIGASQLSIMDDWVGTRRRNAATYTRLLVASGLPVETPPEKPYAWPSYLHYVIRTGARDGLRDYLVSNGIEAKIHYALPIHLHAAFARKFGFRRGMLPVAERFCERVLSLPVAPHVTEDDIHRVVEHLNAFFTAAVAGGARIAE